jgi:hypothetical protein
MYRSLSRFPLRVDPFRQSCTQPLFGHPVGVAPARKAPVLAEQARAMAFVAPDAQRSCQFLQISEVSIASENLPRGADEHPERPVLLGAAAAFLRSHRNWTPLRLSRAG